MMIAPLFLHEQLQYKPLSFLLKVLPSVNFPNCL